MRVDRIRRAPDLPRLRAYEHYTTSIPSVTLHLVQGKYDVVHAFFPSLAWAAVQARRLGGAPVVFSFHGIAAREYLVVRRRRIEMLQQIVGRAAFTTVLSEAAAEPFRRYLQHDPIITPGGVDIEAFGIGAPRSANPCLICPAAVGDPRKRGELLLTAFTALRKRRPTATLLLVGGADPTLSSLEFELPDGVESIEADDTNALASAYSRAWACVLPSIGEAFGLVLLESMAAGTPVIAARSGAAPELVDGQVGRLFEPDDEGDLIGAMDEMLESPPTLEVADACRNRAKQFEWMKVADIYEDLYVRATESGAPRRRLAMVG
jgi:glycosyltransferase involved in cell wall biosynthesis